MKRIEKKLKEIEKKLRKIGSWKLTMTKKQNDEDLTRPGPEALRIRSFIRFYKAYIIL